MRKNGVILIIMCLLLSSCSNDISSDNSCEDNQYISESTISEIDEFATTMTFPVVTNIDATETTNSYSYDVSSMNTDLSFDYIFDELNSYFNLNQSDYYDGDLVHHYIYLGDNIILFQPDYDEFLRNAMEPDPCTGQVGYTPRDYQYHINRTIGVNNTLTIYEFEDEYWAEYFYRRLTNYAYQNDDELIDSSMFEGYCFRIGQFYSEQSKYLAWYYLGDVVVCYSWTFDHDSDEDFNTYLDICERLGLPTSNEAIQEILG